MCRENVVHTERHKAHKAYCGSNQRKCSVVTYFYLVTDASKLAQHPRRQLSYRLLSNHDFIGLEIVDGVTYF